jgi:hypothetical protein
MRKIKSILLLTLAVGIITLNSCSKDKDNAVISTTITASIDGTATTFNNAFALTGTVGGTKFTNVQGTASSKAVLSITINGTITTGKTYTSTATAISDRALLLYAPNDTDDYINDDSNSTKIVTVTVTVTSISSTNIQGTFKGNVTAGSGKVKAITDGKFNVALTGK